MANDELPTASAGASARTRCESIPDFPGAMVPEYSAEVRSPGEPVGRAQHILYDSVSDPTDTESEQEIVAKARRRRGQPPSVGSAGHGTAVHCLAL
ncbi:unnamed protein product [Symbiodinium natans]|uniref:Uncharacterized protein n=1 Tax=Symbiodinium natans TaxID=878477 RepID=A0A812I8S8_9DINO|nr:unnamed protein product [Symbiodinium natans]